MTGISGTTTGITSSAMPRLGATPIATTLGARIWTPTETGPRFRITARCGSRRSLRDGCLIAPATGFGSRTGVGPGCPMNPGAGLRITTDAGSSGAIRGRGGPDQSAVLVSGILTGQSGRRLMSPSSDLAEGALDSASASAVSARLDGCPSGQVTASFRGGAATAGALVW